MPALLKRWFESAVRWLGSLAPGWAPERKSAARFLNIQIYEGYGDPPPLHWKPAHASTIHIFKAEMTCTAGHGLTLKGHMISRHGEVTPSVVCLHEGCHFHEWVRLERWSSGLLI